MRFLNWHKVGGAVRVIVKVRRTPKQWFFEWHTTGERRYSKREVLNIHVRVGKFVNRLPVDGREHETHTVWV